MVDSTEPLFAYFYNHYYTDQFYIFSLARFFVSALILLVPTTMMGATLPILSKYFVTRREQFGWNVGRLYSLNTLGAVIGSFSCGFILLFTRESPFFFIFCDIYNKINEQKKLR